MQPPTMVQIVDSKGQTTNLVEKLAAHSNGGILHRAVSVLVLNTAGQILLQQRARSKYHFAGCWANACCSHPLPFETPAEAANRALKSEIGIQVDVAEIATIVYNAHDATSGYSENEFDHVHLAIWDGEVTPDPAEVSRLVWLEPEDLRIQMANESRPFAPWLHEILSALLRHPIQSGTLEASVLAEFMQRFSSA